tara:strand:+ start:102 stop:869 length:768 start_codon:yes stop_codon:yes gene_type:complete
MADDVTNLLNTMNQYRQRRKDLDDFIRKNRLVSKEAQMNLMMGEGYRDPRFIKTTGFPLIDSFSLQPLMPSGSGQVLSDRQIGMKTDRIAHRIDGLSGLGVYNPGQYDFDKDEILYQTMTNELRPDLTSRFGVRGTQVHELVHRAIHKSGYYDNFYNSNFIKKNTGNLKLRYNRPLIDEALAHAYQHIDSGGKIDDNELKEDIRFRASKFNYKYPNKVADKVFKALPIIKEDFENYLKDLQKIEKQNGKKETRAD